MDLALKSYLMGLRWEGQEMCQEVDSGEWKNLTSDGSQCDDDNVNIFHPQKMVRVPSTPLAALISCQDYNWFGLSRGICVCCLALWEQQAYLASRRENMPLEQPRWLEKAVRQLLQLLAAQLHRWERDWEGERDQLQKFQPPLHHWHESADAGDGEVVLAKTWQQNIQSCELLMVAEIEGSFGADKIILLGRFRSPALFTIFCPCACSLISNSGAN